MSTQTRLNGVAQVFAIILGFVEFVVRVVFVLAVLISIIGAIILIWIVADTRDFTDLITPYLWRLL